MRPCVMLFYLSIPKDYDDTLNGKSEKKYFMPLRATNVPLFSFWKYYYYIGALYVIQLWILSLAPNLCDFHL